MQNLRSKLKSAGIFTLGFLTGLILTGGLLLWHYTVIFQNLYHMGFISNINTASMIRYGREDELLKIIEANMPLDITSADLVLKGKKRLYVLWSIQRYCEKYELDVPAEIRPILDKLPPRPPTPCELYYQQKQNSEPNTQEPNAPPAY